MARRILFFCEGNTCRSPLAAALAAARFAGSGLCFASAGLEAVPGQPAAEGSGAVAAGLGLCLAGHRARRIDTGLLADTAWCIAMTRSQAAIFKRRHRAGYDGALGVLGAPGVDLMQVVHAPPAVEVADPYGSTAARYAACGEQISQLLEAWTAVFAALADGGSAT